MKKQLLSILLVVAMVISVMPVSVFAEDITSGSSQTESYGEFTDGAQIISDMIDKNGMYAHPRESYTLLSVTPKRIQRLTYTG